MTPSSIGAEFLPGLRSCIDALNQPHDDIETAEGVVNEVNDSSGSRRIFKTNGFGRCFAPSCFAWFL